LKVFAEIHAPIPFVTQADHAVPPSLRLPSARLRRAAALAVLGLFAALLLAPGVGAGADPWRGALLDLCHLPGFALATLCLAALLPGRLPMRRRALLAFGGALAFGAATEIGQGWLGRHPSLGDLLLDALGAGIAALWLLWRPCWSPRRLAALGLLVLAGLVVACAPPVSLSLGQARHGMLLPEIGGFGEVSSRQVWRPQGKTSLAWEPTDGGATALRIGIGRGVYGGVSCWPGRQDWRGREALVLEIENPGPPFVLGLRVDDSATRSAADRGWHSDELQIEGGRRRYIVPLAPAERDDKGRGIDLGRVTRLALFTGEEEKGREFLLHSAFLR
jgi:hypothetical protein